MFFETSVLSLLSSLHMPSLMNNSVSNSPDAPADLGADLAAASYDIVPAPAELAAAAHAAAEAPKFTKGAEPFRRQIEALVAFGHGAEAIAEALEIDPAIVRSVAGTATEQDAADMMIVLKGIAQDKGANAGVRVKAATYVHEEAKGRNEKKAVNGAAAMMPVLELAKQLSELRARTLPAKARRVGGSADDAPSAVETPRALEAREA